MRFFRANTNYPPLFPRRGQWDLSYGNHAHSHLSPELLLVGRADALAVTLLKPRVGNDANLQFAPLLLEVLVSDDIGEHIAMDVEGGCRYSRAGLPEDAPLQCPPTQHVREPIPAAAAFALIRFSYRNIVRSVPNQRHRTFEEAGPHDLSGLAHITRLPFLIENLQDAIGRERVITTALLTLPSEHRPFAVPVETVYLGLKRGLNAFSLRRRARFRYQKRSLYARQLRRKLMAKHVFGERINGGWVSVEELRLICD